MTWPTPYFLRLVWNIDHDLLDILALVVGDIIRLLSAIMDHIRITLIQKM